MTTEIATGFDDMTVLSEGGVDVFILNLEEYEDVPPYYVDVAGRRFAYASVTFPVKGQGASLPRFVRETEAEGKLVIMVERKERYLAYIHDPNAEDEEGDEEE
jgi:hypothetical protein